MAHDSKACGMCQTINVGEVERAASVAVGAGLALAGARRGSWLGGVVAALGGALVARGVMGHCAFYANLGIDTNAHPSITAVPAQAGVRIEHAIAIQRSPEDLYTLWHDLESLPERVSLVESVSDLGNGRSHWVIVGPLGIRLEWDAGVVRDRQNKLISWRSLPGAEVQNAGSVHFKPLHGGRCAELRVSMKFNPPAGRLGVSLARLLGSDPQKLLTDDLRRFKEFAERGVIPQTVGGA